MAMTSISVHDEWGMVPSAHLGWMIVHEYGTVGGDPIVDYFTIDGGNPTKWHPVDNIVLATVFKDLDIAKRWLATLSKNPRWEIREITGY